MGKENSGGALPFFRRKHSRTDITDKLLAGSEADNLSSLWMHKRYAGEMLRIIAGGQKFQCPRSLLEEKPETLLGNPEKRVKFFSRGKQALMFCSTLPDVFNALLRYYEGERLERPQRVNLAVFLEQLETFDLSRSDISDMLALEGIDVEQLEATRRKPVVRPRGRLQAKLYDLFDDPHSSTAAKVVQTTSVLITVLSVIVFALETLPSYDRFTLAGKSLSEVRHNPFFILNTICVAYFTFELVIRFCVCPQKVRFMSSFFNWVDLIAVVPYFATLGFMLANVEVQGEASKIAAVRVLRLFRILRILDVNRYTKLRSAKLLFSALLNNIDILSVLLFLLAICNVLFAGFIYTFEQQQQHNNTGHHYEGFSSIPETFWFTLITMTSVGYGDVIPHTAGALFVACATGMTGIIFITFVLQSVVSEFHSLMISNAEYDAYSKRRHAFSEGGGRGKRANSTNDAFGGAGVSGAVGDSSAYAKRGPAFCDREMPIWLHPAAAAHSVSASGSRGSTPTSPAAGTPVGGFNLIMQQPRGALEIVLNVNGAEFSVMDKELARFPHTLLGSRKRRAKFFYPPEGTYYFPRDRDSFPSIHYFYRSGGNLRRPPTVDLRRFVEEVIFFDLGASALIDLLESEGITLRHEEVEPESPRKLYWWRVFERPEFNLLARAVAILSMTATAVSVIIFCAETMPELAAPAYCENFKWIFPARAASSAASQPPPGEPRVHINCGIELALFVTETLCCIWFIIELVGRFVVTPSKTQFVSSFMNWVDLLAILPYMFTVVDKVLGMNYEFVGVNALGLLRVMRLVKLIRVFKFSRHSKRIQMVADIIRAAITELVMSVYFLIIACTLFGSLAYIAESSDDTSSSSANSSTEFNARNSDLTVLSTDELVDSRRRDRQHISSIPAGMYWAWITMLTIGYGDLVPQTVLGKFVGGATAIMGIIFWSLPLTIVSDKFNQFRQLYRDRDYLISVLRKCKRQRRRQEEMFQDAYPQHQQPPGGGGGIGGLFGLGGAGSGRRHRTAHDRIQKWRDKLVNRHHPSPPDQDDDNKSESEMPLAHWRSAALARRAASTDVTGLMDTNGLVGGLAAQRSRFLLMGSSLHHFGYDGSGGGGAMRHGGPPVASSRIGGSSSNLLAPPQHTEQQWFSTSSAATSLESIAVAPPALYESTAESLAPLAATAVVVKLVESSVEIGPQEAVVTTASAPRLVASTVVEVADKAVEQDSIVVHCAEVQADVCCTPPIVTSSAAYVDVCFIPPTPQPQHGSAASHQLNPLQQQIIAARNRLLSNSAEAGPRIAHEYVSFVSSGGEQQARRGNVESRDSMGSAGVGGLAQSTATTTNKKKSKRSSVGSSHDSGSRQNLLLHVGQISAGDRIDSWADLSRYDDDDDQMKVANLPPARSNTATSGGDGGSGGGSPPSRKASSATTAGGGAPNISAMIRKAQHMQQQQNNSAASLSSGGGGTGTPPQQSPSPSQSPLQEPRRRHLPPTTTAGAPAVPSSAASKFLFKRKSSSALLAAGGSGGGGSPSPPLLSRAVMASKRQAAANKLTPLAMPRRGSDPPVVLAAAVRPRSGSSRNVVEAEPRHQQESVTCSVSTTTTKSDSSKSGKPKKLDDK